MSESGPEPAPPPTEPTLHDRLRDAQARLRAAGLSETDAAIDADLLARHVLGWTREQLVVRRREPAPASARFDVRYAACVCRREAREPVAYIIGSREFWGLDFEVTRDVLIPRPETELIVEEVLALRTAATTTPATTAPAASDGRDDRAAIHDGHDVGAHEMQGAHGSDSTHGTPADSLPLGDAPVIVDVGTGSGCLAVALAHELPRAQVIAIDVSTAALHVARRNAERHGVAARIAWHAGSVLEPVDRPVDIIVSNPPYVPLGDAASLPADVRDYEPGVALFSGGDGLATIRALVTQAATRVRPGGWLIFEFGLGQAPAIRDIIAAARDATTGDAVWNLLHLREDLQGIPRTAVLSRR